MSGSKQKIGFRSLIISSTIAGILGVVTLVGVASAKAFIYGYGDVETIMAPLMVAQNSKAGEVVPLINQKMPLSIAADVLDYLPAALFLPMLACPLILITQRNRQLEK